MIFVKRILNLLHKQDPAGQWSILGQIQHIQHINHVKFSLPDDFYELSIFGILINRPTTNNRHALLGKKYLDQKNCVEKKKAHLGWTDVFWAVYNSGNKPQFWKNNVLVRIEQFGHIGWNNVLGKIVQFNWKSWFLGKKCTIFKKKCCSGSENHF